VSLIDEEMSVNPDDNYDFIPESPIEQMFLDEFRKFVADGVSFGQQITINTDWGNFRADFEAVADGKKYIFECDGAEFHEEFRDEFRDALILGTGSADVIYRLPGSVVFRRCREALLEISRLDPELFSSRSIEVLSHESIKNHRWFLQENGFDPDYYPYYVGVGCLLMKRRSRVIEPGIHQHWPSLFSFAELHRGCRIDKLVELRKATWNGGKR